MINGMTFDIEDWRQLVHWKLTGQVIDPMVEAERETDRILRILAAASVRGTFFVLANMARRFPDLIRRIDAEGHEVGSHGFSHKLIYRQTEEEFRSETRSAKRLLEDTIGRAVVGYRAAEFSIVQSSRWALDVLAEEGFAYDSSIFPIAGPRYGIPGAPLAPHVIPTRGGGTLREFPLTTLGLWGRRLPAAGGGYLRLLPYAVTRIAIEAANRDNRPAIVYLHPYEFARDRLRPPANSGSMRVRLRYSIVHNLGRARLSRTFQKLLRDFQFAPLREL